MRIAQACHARGYAIRVYVLEWSGEAVDNFDIRHIKTNAISNHKKHANYWCQVKADMDRDPVAGVIGFNKMPGLDVYFAADSCFEAKSRKQRGPLYRLTPRYNHFRQFEEAVFGPESSTEILMISEQEIPVFKQYYHTQSNRFHMLPPGISRSRMAPDNSSDIRATFRAEFGIGDEEHLLLMVGSGFKTKGVDRSIEALAQLPGALKKKTRLFVIGQDNPKTFISLARRLGVTANVKFFPGRDDVLRFMLGADLLVHPAYNENAGMVLLEAIIAGLPVLVNDVCGYAHYVEDARAGVIMRSPFILDECVKEIENMLLSSEKTQWRQNGIAFSKTADIYSMHEHAADFIAKVINDSP